MPGSPVADIRNSFGVALVGLFLSTTLFGLAVVQTWIYFWRYWKKDTKALKFLVTFISALDTLHTSLCAYAIYWYLILNFGNVESLDYIVWALNIQINVGTVVGACAQIYYARQVYLLSKSIICPILIVALVAIAFSLGFAFSAKAFALGRFSRIHTVFWIPCLGMTALALADLLIAAAMCWSLYHKRTGSARNDSIIMTSMTYSINSGLVKSLLSTAAIIRYVVSPSSMIWQALLWVAGKCAVISLLAMLNSRDYIHERPSAGNPDNACDLPSARIEPLSEAYGSKFRQFRAPVSVYRSTAPKFTWRKSKHDGGLAFEVPKSGTSIIPSQGQSRTSESSA